MQAIKRYVAVLVISLFILLGYFNLRLPDSGYSVNGKFSSIEESNNFRRQFHHTIGPDYGRKPTASSKEQTEQSEPSLSNTKELDEDEDTSDSNKQQDANLSDSKETHESVQEDVIYNLETKIEAHLGKSEQNVNDAFQNPSTNQSELDRHQHLDEKYNMTKVVHVDLHDLDFLDGYYSYNYEAIKEIIDGRMKRVETVCREINNKRSKHYNLYQFNELGITWCPVFKSGSTTWRNFFITEFVEDPPEKYFLNLLKSRQLLSGKKAIAKDSKQLFRDENEDNTRFTMVRHPFARLVSHVKSSGRDHEMVNQKDLWIFSAITTARSKRVPNNADCIRFKSEFNKYFTWLEDGRPGEVFKDGSPDNPFLNPPYPLLSELVNHIIKMRRSNRDWDGHWMPAFEFCNICINKFDYIIRLEDEPLELWYLVDKLGLWEHRTTFLNRANTSSKKETEMADVWTEIEKLDKQQIDFLSRHFDIDFRMFGYRRGRPSS